MRKEDIIKVVTDYIAGSDIVIIDVTISPSNEIEVILDAIKGVSIDKCIEVSRHIESQFDRDKEDFELTVASASISEPFRVKLQYEKNIGKEIEVMTTSGKKFVGELISVADNDFTIMYEEKVAVEGKKRKEIQQTEQTLLFDEVRSTKLTFKF